MKHCKPHFNLFSESNAEDQPGRWRFVLRMQENGYVRGDDSSGTELFEAGGSEEDVRGERLELLCVVRGLESLDQPSRVTLITTSDYVREGIHYGLEQWRENQWQWESFGRMVPVKNQDLWQRVDSALQFHRLDCRIWRLDTTHEHGVNEYGPHKYGSKDDPAENTIIDRQTAGVYRRFKRKMLYKTMRCLVVLRRRILVGTADLKHAAGFGEHGDDRGVSIQTERTLAGLR